MLTEIGADEVADLHQQHRDRGSMRLFADRAVADMADKPAGTVCEVTGYEEHANRGIKTTPLHQCYSAAKNAIHAMGYGRVMQPFTANGRMFIQKGRGDEGVLDA